MTARHLGLLLVASRKISNVVPQCSHSTFKPQHVKFDDPCPEECPYSQPLDGGSCEKVCVKAELCPQFHPVRSYADPWSFQCTPPCGKEAIITGCSKCSVRGLCQRCSQGLLGMSLLVLSDDGTRCENHAASMFRFFYYFIGALVFILLAYMVHLMSRSVQNAMMLKTAQEHRERLKVPHDHDAGQWWNFNVHQRDIAGKGIALYFNSVCFVMLIAVVLFSVSFSAYEHSDYARQLKMAPRCDFSSIPVPLHFARPAPSIPNTTIPNEVPIAIRSLHRNFRDFQADVPRRKGAHHRRGHRGRHRTRDAPIHRHHRPVATLIASTQRQRGTSERVEAMNVDRARRQHTQRHQVLVDEKRPNDTEARKETKDAFVTEKKNDTVRAKKNGAATPKDQALSPLDRFLSSYRKMWDPILQAPKTEGLEAKYEQFHSRMFHACILLYILVLCMSWVFQAWQLDHVETLFQDTGGTDYCLLISNVPRHMTDGRELTDFFRQLCGEDPSVSDNAATHRSNVIGTSLAYDYFGSDDRVSAAVSEWVREVEGAIKEASVVTPRDAERQPAARDKKVMTEWRDDVIFTALTPHDPYTANWKSSLSPHSSDIVSYVSGGIGLILSLGIWSLDNVAMRVTGLRDQHPDLFYGSGSAYVIFRTVEQCTLMRRKVRKHRPVLTYEGKKFPLHCSLHCADPCDIYWKHHTSWSHFWHKITLGIFMMIGVVILWILMYVPYAMYSVNFANIPGISPSETQNILLGFLIALANLLLAVVIEKVTSWAGFCSKANRDVAVLSFAFVGSFLNTMFDLVMVAHLARGAALDAAILGETTGYGTAVANELYGLIIPGYLILPYFAVPIFEHLLPYWLAVWLIRSRVTIYLHSESALQCPGFDICWRYADCLNNTTICLILLFFVSSNSWRVMLWLLAFLLIIYVIDRFLLLRCTTATYYASNRLDVAFSYWWCFPTSILAFAVAFWGHKAYHFPLLSVGFCGVAIHVLVYCGMVTAMTRRAWQPEANRVEFPEMYRKRREAGHKVWDYFNTNPIFCLRTRYLGAEASGWADIRQNLGVADDECIPFCPGKGWLLRRQKNAQYEECATKKV